MPATIETPPDLVPGDRIGILLEELLTDWPLFARVCQRMGQLPAELLEPVSRAVLVHTYQALRADWRTPSWER